MDALGVMSNAIVIIELARRVASMAYSIHQWDWQDVSSMETDIDVARSHLLALQVRFEGNDLERIILRCIESGANASAILGRLGTADPSERVQFAYSIRTELLGLDRQLSNLVLKWIHEHKLEVWQLLRRTSMVRWNPQPQPYMSIYHTSRFVPPGELLQPCGSAFLHLLTSNISASDREACERNMKNHILTEIYNGQGQLSSPVHINDPVLENSIQRSFLWRLRDPNIGCEKAKVNEPRKRLYNWLFEPSSDRDGNGTGFRDWFTNSSNTQTIFWILGKPGAGKTTLMKEIDERFSRSEYLSRQTNVVSCFSVHDRPNQKGVRELLQSILYQLLSKNPELIPLISPSRWTTWMLFGEDPKPIDTEELQKMLVATLRQRRRIFATMILIDGLDEYEGTKGSFGIPELLYIITACPGVKACVSSRPLSYLQSLIDPAPSLILDNCNGQDIEAFISSKIETQLASTRHSIVGLGVKEQVIYELHTRAEGCFLWVLLVTDALRKLVTEKTEDDELLRFVNNVPTKLAELFRCFQDQLDASQPFVAHTLRFIAKFDEPITPLRLCIMEMPFPEFALRQDISYLPYEELHIRSQETSEKIIDVCGGFLEICEWDGRVVFTHRTVKEYFRADTVWDSQPKFVGFDNFAARYSAASLSILKMTPISELTIQLVSTEATRCSYTATFAGKEEEPHVSKILDELELFWHAVLDTSHSMLSPWSGFESNDFAQNYESTESFYKYQALWDIINLPVLQNDKISAALRMRAMTLCAKYSIAGWASLQSTMYHWPHRKCQSCPRYIKRSLINSSSSMLYEGYNERREDYTGPLQYGEIECDSTRDIEGGGHHSLQRDVGSVSIINRAVSSTDDGSDNMSWESWSSEALSLDEAHPLMALRDEAVDAVFQGFIEYRKRHI